ncbi:MAG: alpha/beta fold hydrolase BchO [Pseudomonadota bacterium]
MPRLDWARDGRSWPHHQASRFLRAGETSWHVQIMGDGPEILLVHGTGASAHSWSRIMPLLAERFTVIAPDLPGHGFSDAASALDLSLPGMVRSFSALLSVLDARPKIVVGHSAGAAVLAQMILEERIGPERLVSINGAFMPFKGMAAHVFPPIAKALIWNPLVPQAVSWAASDRKAVRRLIDGTGSKLDQASLDLYHRLFQCPGHVRATLNMMARWDLVPVLKRLPDLPVPLLLISGGRDATVPPSDQSEIARRVPGAELVCLAELGHLAHEEAPQEIAALL